jgi:hypothetical protein
MNINLHELLPANISNEAAFHVVKFVRDLAIALESIYFDHLLQHQTVSEHDPFCSELENNNENPF